VSWFLSHLLTVIGFVCAIAVLAGLSRDRRSPQSTLAWLLVVALVPYVGVPLYFIFGGRKMRRLAQGKTPLYIPSGRVLPAEQGSSIERILCTDGSPRASGGNRVELLDTGERAYESLIALLERSTRSIHIATFILGGDEVGRSVLEVLERKAREGLEVRLLVDALFAFRADHGALERLHKAGGRYAFFMPVLHIPFRGHANLRNHRKITVVDGEQAILGGMNLAREYMGPLPVEGRWRDLNVRVQGPAAADADAVFRSDWSFAAKETLEATPTTASSPKNGGVVQLTASGPDVRADTLYDALVSALFSATSRIFIATPYFIPDETLAHALVLATRRGVDVRVVVPLRSNHWTADIAGGGYLRQVQDAGGRVLPYLDGMMHAKAVVIDQSIGVLGSANMDMRSLFLDYEVALFFYSAPEIEAIASWFGALFARCGERLPPPTRFRAGAESVGRLLAPLV
jgi:cardiolipin synthase